MQSFCPATIFKYCFRDARWRLTLKDDSVVVNDDNLTITIDCATIEKITTAGIIFSDHGNRHKSRSTYRLAVVAFYIRAAHGCGNSSKNNKCFIAKI